MPTYLQGLTIGLAYVAPIGMQNLFVINSALTQPRRRALLTALIVIAFDISLALACFFGIGALVEPARSPLDAYVRLRRAGGALRLAAAPDSDRGRLHRGVDRHRPAAG